MTAHPLVTRRVLLRDMGKAGLAVMVLGTAACTSDPTSNATPTDEPTSTAAGGVETSAATPTTASPEPLTTNPAPGGHQWHRVNLGFVSAYILHRGGEATVVDTGVDGSALSIEGGLGEIGLGWGDVAGLVLTHKHPDHQGSTRAVLDNVPAGTPWFAGAGDLAAITAATEGTAVGDGDTVNGLDIVETPGHTPGHISVLDSESGILVAGDALNGENGGVVGPDAGFSEDIAMANASVTKLAGFDYEIALFGHGEPILVGASAAVATLAGSLG